LLAPAQPLAQSYGIGLFRKASTVIRNRGGYWQVKVYAGLDPLTGKQRFEYDRAKTKREAVRVEAALKTKVAEGRSRGTAARTVADASLEPRLAYVRPMRVILPHCPIRVCLTNEALSQLTGEGGNGT
jgi:hypothetical protein